MRYSFPMNGCSYTATRQWTRIYDYWFQIWNVKRLPGIRLILMYFYADVSWRHGHNNKISLKEFCSRVCVRATAGYSRMRAHLMRPIKFCSQFIEFYSWPHEGPRYIHKMIAFVTSILRSTSRSCRDAIRYMTVTWVCNVFAHAITLPASFSA